MQEPSVGEEAEGCDPRYYWTPKQRGDLGEIDYIPVFRRPLFLFTGFDIMNRITNRADTK